MADRAMASWKLHAVHDPQLASPTTAASDSSAIDFSRPGSAAEPFGIRCCAVATPATLSVRRRSKRSVMRCHDGHAFLSRATLRPPSESIGRASLVPGAVGAGAEVGSTSMHAVTMCHFYQTVGWSNNLVLN